MRTRHLGPGLGGVGGSPARQDPVQRCYSLDTPLGQSWHRCHRETERSASSSVTCSRTTHAEDESYTRHPANQSADLPSLCCAAAHAEGITARAALSSALGPRRQGLAGSLLRARVHGSRDLGGRDRPCAQFEDLSTLSMFQLSTKRSAETRTGAGHGYRALP